MRIPAALKAIAAQAAGILRRHIAAGYMPGAVALVGRGPCAEVVVVGDQTRDDAVPMQRDSIFRIASMTKPVTAAATMMLIEDGKLRLDEPIDRWLPELANRRVLRQIDGPLDDTVPAKRAITVEDLLTFRCGMGLVLASPDTRAARHCSMRPRPAPGQWHPPFPMARRDCSRPSMTSSPSRVWCGEMALSPNSGCCQKLQLPP